MEAVNAGLITKLFKKLWDFLKKDFEKAGYTVDDVKEDKKGVTIISVSAGEGKYKIQAKCTPVGLREALENVDDEQAEDQAMQVGESLLDSKTLYDVEFTTKGEPAISVKNVPAKEFVGECKKAVKQWFNIDDVATVAGSRKIRATLLKAVDASRRANVSLVTIQANYEPKAVLADLYDFVNSDELVEDLTEGQAVPLEIDVTNDGYEYEVSTDLSTPVELSLQEILKALWRMYVDSLYLSYYMVGSGAPSDARNSCDDARWMSQSQADKLAEICIELGVDVPHPSELLERDCILCSMNTDERMEHIFNRATDIIAAIDLYYCNFEKDVQSVLDNWLRGWKNLVYYRMRSVPELLSDDAILPLEIE